MKKFLLYAILILAVFGAADAGYLVIQSVSGKIVVCPNVSVGRFNLSQCNIVLATSYAKFLGLPLALYGLIAYLFLAILVLYEQNARDKRDTVKILSILSGAGVLFSAYLVYLQFLVIKALCFYCFVSAAIITLIFVLSAAYNMKYSKGV